MQQCCQHWSAKIRTQSGAACQAEDGSLNSAPGDEGSAAGTARAGIAPDALHQIVPGELVTYLHTFHRCSQCSPASAGLLS